MAMRRLHRDKDNKPVAEPYCGKCQISLNTFVTYCDCGWTYEERLASKFKLDGTCPKPKEKSDEAVRHEEPIR